MSEVNGNHRMECNNSELVTVEEPILLMGWNGQRDKGRGHVEKAALRSTVIFIHGTQRAWGHLTRRDPRVTIPDLTLHTPSILSELPFWTTRCQKAKELRGIIHISSLLRRRGEEKEREYTWKGKWEMFDTTYNQEWSAVLEFTTNTWNSFFSLLQSNHFLLKKGSI